MRYRGNSIAGLLGVLAAALLLPGGLLLLAWALFARGNRGWRMTRWLPLVAVLGVLQGCATQLEMRAASRSGDPETASPSAVLKFQRLSMVPGNEALVVKDDLQPGDILLSSAPTLRSSAIQMMTLAPVSHAAVYIGNGEVVEAVLPSVRVRSLGALLKEENAVLVLRHPDLTAEQARSMRDYALQQTGTRFNALGVAMHAPFGVIRKVCELPLMPPYWRDACIRGVGGVFHVATSKVQFFCSQLVLQSYRHAGVPITVADPRLISPADILHMREGDVSSVRIHQRLRQVGHLKYDRPITVALQQR